MQRRKAIIIRSKKDAWAKNLEAQLEGWELLPAKHIHSVRQVLADHKIFVGILHWDCQSEKSSISWIERVKEELLLIDKPIMWIAILPRWCTYEPEIRQFIREYLFDFHMLPVDVSRLHVILGHAYGMAKLSSTIESKRAEKKRLLGCEVRDFLSSKFNMVGTSAVMQAMYRDIRKVARVEAPVLIMGESGTGKELVALAIHKHSKRKESPFVAVNCGALPANLIQSELFGHEKGSFTGAHQRKLGRIELAHGGTIFLDEIGDLSLALQVNLLRFLEEMAIDRVGGSGSIPVDVRVIAATHINLEEAVQAGRFRQDLYFRLNVLDLKTPPLRERNGDIESLAQFYLEKFSAETPRKIIGYCHSSLEAMNRYHWPGNVRELVNRVRRATVMCEGRYIRPEHLGLNDRIEMPRVTTLEEARASAEKEAIESALRHYANNVTKTATVLGVSRRTLYRLMERHWSN